MQYAQIVVPEAIGGTVTVVENALTVVVDSTMAAAINALATDPIGRRQIFIGSGGGNLFEIRQWDGVDTLTLNRPVPITSGDYTGNIVKAYYLPPLVEQAVGIDPAESSNFKCYHVVKDKTNNFPLILDHASSWIDKRDPRLDSQGTPTHFLQFPPTTNRFPGSGNDPGQIPPGTPRFQLWPIPTGTYVYEALYELLYWPLSDDTTSTLPETLNPDLVLYTAMVKALQWSMGARDITAQYRVALRERLAFAIAERDRLYLEAYREDKLQYAARVKDLLGGKFPYVMGAAYAQVHDINLMSGLYSD